MNNPTGPETVAAANALSGERTHATLTYPVTGYAECDAITAILTLLKDIPCRRAQRIGEYIAARFKDCADEQFRNSDFQAKMQLANNPQYVGQALGGYGPPNAKTGLVEYMEDLGKGVTTGLKGGSVDTIFKMLQAEQARAQQQRPDDSVQDHPFQP